MTTQGNTLQKNNGIGMTGFVFFVLMFGAFLALVVLGTHAVERHGVTSVSSVRAEFNGDGSCKSGPSAELYSSSLDTWLYICFHAEDKASLWILSKDITNSSSKEITAIPSNQMRNAVAYIKNMFGRGYRLENSFGVLPDWFKLIFGGL